MPVASCVAEMLEPPRGWRGGLDGGASVHAFDCGFNKQRNVKLSLVKGRDNGSVLLDLADFMTDSGFVRLSYTPSGILT